MDRAEPGCSGPVGPVEAGVLDAGPCCHILSSPAAPADGPHRSASPSTAGDATPDSCFSPPISVSSSPDMSICWQVSAPTDAPAAQEAATAAYICKIEALTKQLSNEAKLRRQAEQTLARIASGDVLAHVKGLEQVLSHQKKKVRALEAINDSLRLQLSKHQPIPPKRADDIQKGEHVRAEGGVREHVRTWSRFTSSGVSPCRKASATSGCKMFEAPLRTAQVFMQKEVSKEMTSAELGHESMNNDRSISFIAEVNAAIRSHRVDTPGMEARAYRRSRFALLLASLCTWKEWMAYASSCADRQTKANFSSSFVEMPHHIVPGNGSIEPRSHGAINIHEISPTPTPCPYSPINFGDLSSAVVPSPSPSATDGDFDFRGTSPPAGYRTEVVPHRIECTGCGGGQVLDEKPCEVDENLRCSNSLDNLRQIIANQCRERSRSRSSGVESRGSSPADTTSLSVDSVISHPPPQPLRILPWQSPMWVHQPTVLLHAARESAHFAALC